MRAARALCLRAAQRSAGARLRPQAALRLPALRAASTGIDAVVPPQKTSTGVPGYPVIPRAREILMRMSEQYLKELEAFPSAPPLPRPPSSSPSPALILPFSDSFT